MVRQLLLDQVSTPLPLEDETTEAIIETTLEEELTAYRDGLVTSYLSYLKAAGYCQLKQEIHKFELGAWRFISCFPDPTDWPSLDMEELRYCGRHERSFLHYLFLRRILPLPPAYLLTPRPHLYQMAIRLMEKETYKTYRKAAERLGYGEQDSKNQFRPLLCLMVWSQKPLEALTLEDLEDFIQALRTAFSASQKPCQHTRLGLPRRWDYHLSSIRNVLYHMGVFPRLDRSARSISFDKQWARVPLPIGTTVRRYLQQLALSFRPGSTYQEKTRLFHFFSWLAQNMPEVTRITQIQRYHIEAFKEYLCSVPLQHKSNRKPGDMLSPNTRRNILSALLNFFIRLTEWQWPEAPRRTLMFIQDLPLLDHPLPRFLDEVTAAKFLQAARSHSDLFTRLCGVTLLLTGMRVSEFLGLTADSIVRIGENDWLRVPLGKTHRDRYVPLSLEVKQLLEEWKQQHPPLKSYDFIFTERGLRFARTRIEKAMERISKAAGIEERINPHRLRHTLATLAINRGMPLESVAALLGHRSLSMTMVYARIGNRTVQQEYALVSQHLEDLCTRVELPGTQENISSPALIEGTQMQKLRKDTWRLLGNGYCTRPVKVPCEYETICESCPCFSTTIDFLPILQKQKQDAEDKGQTQRLEIFKRLIQKVEQAPEGTKDI
jgi:site-specific recombinase XerD